MKSCLPVLAMALVSGFSPGLAATVTNREGAVREGRAKFENDRRWIYNDYKRGFVEAKRTGKPLLVVLRCVPCLACAGIDSAVLEADAETQLAPLLNHFVCVRVIDANSLNLKLFQFDYDLSFSTLFFNGDGTLYGRYGSWRHQKDPQDKTTASYRRALEGAWELHKGYPANKETLKGKQGNDFSFDTPIAIPSLASKYKAELDWDDKVVQSCVHCHQIGEALRADLRAKKQPMPERLIFPWPGPEVLGLTLAAGEMATVEAVEPNSPASKAGIQPGDQLVSLARQPLISIADVSWALDHFPESGDLPARIKSGDKEKAIRIALPAGWRAKNNITRRVGTWDLRGMAAGGLVLEDLSDAARQERNLSQQSLALLVKSVGQYGKHAAAKNAGFQKDDVIVEIDQRTSRITESELLGYLLKNHNAGERVKAVVLRADSRVELNLPMQ